MQKCRVKFVGHTPGNEVIVVESVVDSNEDFVGTEDAFVEQFQDQLNNILTFERLDSISFGNARINIQEFATLQFHVSKYVENTVNMKRKI